MRKTLKNGNTKVKPHGSNLDPAKRLNAHGITVREEQFCQAYLIDFNISKAERTAGIGKGVGHNYMAKESIRKRISQIRIDTGKALDITREKILQELMKMVYADPRGLFDPSGKRLNPGKWDDDTASTIAGVDIDLLGEVKSVKRWDKLKAIELLNKMLGYNVPEVTQIEIKPASYDKEELLEIAKMLEGLI